MANDFMNGQEEIDLLKLLQALWKKIWIIVGATIVGGIVLFLYTYFFVTPMYQTTALLYVNNNSVNIGSTKVNISSSDIYASNSLVETYSVILKSRNTLLEAISEGQIPYTYEELLRKVSGSAEGDTPVFKITVIDKDPDMAAHIANQIVDVITDKISDIVDGSSVKVVDLAVSPKEAYSPNYLKNTAIGMLIGFVLSCGVIILMSLMDSTIREEDFLLDKYKNIPILSSIPDLSEDSAGGYYGYGKSYAKASEKARNGQTKQASSAAAPTRPAASQNDNPFVMNNNDGSEGK